MMMRTMSISSPVVTMVMASSNVERTSTL